MAIKSSQPDDNILANPSQLNDWIDVVMIMIVIMIVIMKMVIIIIAIAIATRVGRRRILQAPSL